MNSNTSGFYSSPITKELEAQLYISQNHPVRGGDLRIHIKQEEIKARRLATYPDSHANNHWQSWELTTPHLSHDLRFGWTATS